MNLEHLLTEDQLHLREMMRNFSRKEIIPVAKQIEDDYGLVEQIHQKLVDIGIQSSGYPAEYGGGGGLSHMNQCIICEELAKGDAGISQVVLINAGMMVQPAIMSGNKSVLDRFCPPFCHDTLAYACISMTDEAGGCDTENPLLHGAGIRTTAKLEKDEWVINGAKSWPTNGGLADIYLTVCTTDVNAGDEGVALIYVPPDTKGLSFGKPEKKMLFKTVVNSSIFYDNVRVPKEYRASGPGMDANFFKAATADAQWHSSVIALGVAERAFDIVLDYTGTRTGGFKPVRQHTIVAGIIADMAIGIEMMRAGVYNLSWMFDHHDQYGMPFEPEFVAKAAAVRVYCGDTAVNIINKGAELLGSIAISEDFPYEKCLRDIKETQLWLGGQQISRYRVACGYYDLKNWA